MKLVRNKKLYNTETATLLFSSRSGQQEGGEWWEEIYKKQSGEMFLLIMAKGYEEYCDNIIIGEDEVREYIESAFTWEEYESIFGTVEE